MRSTKKQGKAKTSEETHRKTTQKQHGKARASKEQKGKTRKSKDRHTGTHQAGKPGRQGAKPGS